MSEVQTTDAGISRRRVVQGALWAAPVVVVATAVPAAATSLANGTMQFASGVTFTRTATAPRHYVFTGLALQHTGGAPITSLIVTITSDVNMLLTPAVTGSGWSLGTASAKLFTFVYSGSISSGGALTPSLGVDFTRANMGGGPATFTVSAVGSTNSGSGNTSASIAAPFSV